MSRRGRSYSTVSLAHWPSYPIVSRRMSAGSACRPGSRNCMAAGGLLTRWSDRRSSRGGTQLGRYRSILGLQQFVRPFLWSFNEASLYRSTQIYPSLSNSTDPYPVAENFNFAAWFGTCSGRCRCGWTCCWGAFHLKWMVFQDMMPFLRLKSFQFIGVGLRMCFEMHCFCCRNRCRCRSCSWRYYQSTNPFPFFQWSSWNCCSRCFWTY